MFTVPTLTSSTGGGTTVNAGYGVLPQYLLDQTAQSLSGALRGELPQDVQDLLQQQAAEYGVASGFPGSQFAGYRGLRNLGLTSMDRIREAEKQLSGQFTTPAQAEQLAQGRSKIALESQAQQLAQALEQQKLNLARERTAAATPSPGVTYPRVTAAGGTPSVVGRGGTGAAASPAQLSADIINRYLRAATGLPAYGAGAVAQQPGMLEGATYGAPDVEYAVSPEDLAGQEIGLAYANELMGMPAEDQAAAYYGFTPEEYEYFGDFYE